MFRQTALGSLTPVCYVCYGSLKEAHPMVKRLPWHPTFILVVTAYVATCTRAHSAGA